MMPLFAEDLLTAVFVLPLLAWSQHTNLASRLVLAPVLRAGELMFPYLCHHVFPALLARKNIWNQTATLKENLRGPEEGKVDSHSNFKPLLCSAAPKVGRFPVWSAMQNALIYAWMPVAARSHSHCQWRYLAGEEVVHFKLLKSEWKKKS